MILEDRELKKKIKMKINFTQLKKMNALWQ
jgi:hypothetical protein